MKNILGYIWMFIKYKRIVKKGCAIVMKIIRSRGGNKLEFKEIKNEYCKNCFNKEFLNY